MSENDTLLGFEAKVREAGDPVGNFFDHLPSPETDYASAFSTSSNSSPEAARFLEAVETFLDEATSRPSLDEDYAFLHRQFSKLKATDTLTVDAVLDTLALLAVTEDTAVPVPVSPSVSGGNKGQHMEYIAWVVRGRKDESSPFATATPEQVPTQAPVDHSCLPDINPDKTCAACGKPGAKGSCGRCWVVKEGRLTFGTCYCTRQCQIAHWNEHKTTCAALLKVERAISILDELVALSSGSVLDTCGHPITIQEKDGMLMVKIPSWAEELRLAYCGAPVVGKVEVANSTQEQVRAALASGSCREVLGGPMRVLLELLLKPMFESVEIVQFWPKNMHRPVCEFKGTMGPNVERVSFNSLVIHEVIRVTLKDGSKLVIDPSHRQYGWKEYLALWDVYAKERVHRLFLEGKIDSLAAVDVSGPSDGPSLGRKIDKYSQERVYGFPDLVGPFLSETVNRALAACLYKQADEEFNGMNALLSLPETEFKDARRFLVDKAKALLDDFGGMLQSRKDYRYYLNTKMKHEVALGSELCEKLENVWLSQEEYDEHKDSPEELELAWKEKWAEEMGEDDEDDEAEQWLHPEDLMSIASRFQIPGMEGLLQRLQSEIDNREEGEEADEGEAEDDGDEEQEEDDDEGELEESAPSR